MARNGSYWDCNAKCPFYKSQSKKAGEVVCCGVVRGQTAHLRFTSERRRTEWLENHCADWRFSTCPYYAAQQDER